jgi:hypothetical protein
LGAEEKGASAQNFVLRTEKGIREGAHGVFVLYRPTPKEVKKACKPEERIQQGSKSQFGYEK